MVFFSKADDLTTLLKLMPPESRNKINSEQLLMVFSTITNNSLLDIIHIDAMLLALEAVLIDLANNWQQDAEYYQNHHKENEEISFLFTKQWCCFLSRI